MSDDLPASVRAAFSLPSGPARCLPGGSVTRWQAGGLVLEPGQHEAVGRWLAELFDGLSGPGFRVPRPVRAADGSWIVEGWAAWTAVEGEPAPLRRWPDLVAAGRAFHTALAGVPVPRWVGRGRNRWAVADRVAWAQTDVDLAPELADLVGELRAATRPIALPGQLVHGDIAGNVLFAAQTPPVVIGFSPFERPAGYPLAVAAVDLLAWSAAPPSILDELADEAEIDQLLLRALMFRLVTESLGRSDPDSRRAVRRANEPVVELLLSRASGRVTNSAPPPGPDIAELVGRALGEPINALRPVPGGHSESVTRLADRTGGGAVFVKAAGPADHAGLDAELAVYQALDGNRFLPRRLASTREPHPILVLEALESAGWVHDWTPHLIAATRTLLHEVHALPAPAGVPVLDAVPNPWDAIAADPTRLLRMGVCSNQWLARHLDTLRAAAAEAPTAGASLIHRDVRAANLWFHGGRVVLVDWASAMIGDPWLDLHLWLVALHAEGGPAPDSGQGRHAVGHAALIAGQQPLLTPARYVDPTLFDQRRRNLAVALSWAARLLGIPAPRSTI